MRSRTLFTLAVLAIGAMLALAAVAVAENITGTQGDDQVSALAGKDNVSGNNGGDLNGADGDNVRTGNQG